MKTKLPKTKFPIKNIQQFIDVEGLDLESIVERKQLINLELNELIVEEGEERTVVANVTVMKADSDGDIVVPEGSDLERFQKNPIIYFGHNYSLLPVGKATDILVKEDRIQMKVVFASTDFARDVWTLFKEGVLKGFSLGFLIKKSLTKGTKAFNEYVKEKGLQIDNAVKRIITEYKIFETSVAGIPANEDALRTAISTKSFVPCAETIKELQLEEIIEKGEVIEVEEPEVVEKIEGVNEVVTEILDKEDKEDKEVPEEYEMIDPEVEKILMEIRDNEIDAEVKELIEIEDEEAKLPEIKSIVRVGSYDIKKEIKNYQRKKRGKII